MKSSSPSLFSSPGSLSVVAGAASSSTCLSSSARGSPELPDPLGSFPYFKSVRAPVLSPDADELSAAGSVVSGSYLHRGPLRNSQSDEN